MLGADLRRWARARYAARAARDAADPHGRSKTGVGGLRHAGRGFASLGAGALRGARGA